MLKEALIGLRPDNYTTCAASEFVMAKVLVLCYSAAYGQSKPWHMPLRKAPSLRASKSL
ncbi:hypothetical protein EV128_103285 [Rhizobium azibense]|nr:hypothetical protein EV128_103285 [Rhizobium azibense]